MSFTVRIRNLDEEIVLEPDERILAVALEENLPYPHGCKSGNCGACKSVLHSGRVRMAPHSKLALSEEEEARGLILACRSTPLEDCEVSFAALDEAPAHPVRRLQGRVAEVERMTRDVVRVRIETDGPEPLDFSAGQYATVAFPGLPARDFSFANRPGESVLEFHVRALDGGRVSRFVVEELKPGEPVMLEGPYGVAHLREEHRGPILALAGSTGLAPIKSIVERALAIGLKQPIHVYLGVRAEADVYLEDHFRALADAHENVDFAIGLSEPVGSTGRRTGTLADMVRQDFNDLDGAKVYLAGPPVMVETCVEAVKALGVREEDCHADAFYTEAEKADGKGG